MKIKFDFHPCLTFHGWKDYNYYNIIPRITLFTAPRYRSNWDETLIGKHFDLTIGWLVFEVSIGMECLWKEIAKPKFKVGDHICNENIADAVVKAVNIDETNNDHWYYECVDLQEGYHQGAIFYISAEIEHLWDLKKEGEDGNHNH